MSYVDDRLYMDSYTMALFEYEQWQALYGHQPELWGVFPPPPSPLATQPARRPGAHQVRWHSEDARLALIVAGRLRGRKDIPLLVIANDQALVEEHMGPRTGYECLAAQVPGDALVDVLQPGDLIVAPSYLLPEMPIARRIRLSNRLADQNLAIVAGPGRLAVAPTSTPHATEQILGPQV